MVPIRSAMCASGRWETKRARSIMKPVAPAAASWQSTLRWVMMTPLGFPVVPEVYSTVTGPRA